MSYARTSHRAGFVSRVRPDTSKGARVSKSWSRPTVEVAKALLRVMRQPHKVLDSVVERVEMLDRRQLRRHVTLRFRPDAFARGMRWAYVDVLHPSKGGLSDLQLEDSSGAASITSHVEHREVSATLIRHRLLSVLNSAHVPPAQLRTFHNQMSLAYAALARLPFQRENDAVTAVDAHFDRRSGILRAALQPGVVLSARKMRYLFELCTRLEKRYLVLIRLATAPGTAAWVRFSHHTDATELDVNSRTWQGPRSALWNRLYASPPSSIRVHVPWAKRASHYVMHLDAPEQHFLARQVLLLARRRRGRAQRMHVVPDASLMKWSIHTGQGNRARIFLSRARREPLAVFVGIQALELPGRSTWRAFLLSLFTTVTLAGFTLFWQLSDQPSVMPTAALVVAFLAVGGFAVNPTAGPGVLGHPMLSRFTPGALSLLGVLYIFWLGAHDATLRPEIMIAPEVSTLLQVSYDIGGWAIVLVAFVLTFWVGARCFALIHHYRRTSGETFRVSNNFS